MTGADLNAQPRVTAELVAEAAAWLAILHGPNRTAEVERGFGQWLKSGDGHARAFEEATAIWEEARRLPRAVRLRTGRGRQFPFVSLAAAAAILIVLVASAVLYFRMDGVSTDIGEQRVLALEDGSRVVLNTNTRVVVAYSREQRRVELKKGEALFEVAEHSDWPFVVWAGERRVRALGTSFVVRRDADRVAVTLVEGKVAVADRVLAPGDRVVLAENKAAALPKALKIDRPALDKALAWERREVALDNAALGDAVAEMNRYNRKPIEVGVPEAGVRVTGLFRAGDSMSFARAVAEAYGLTAREESGRIVIGGRVGS